MYCIDPLEAYSLTRVQKKSGNAFSHASPLEAYSLTRVQKKEKKRSINDTPLEAYSLTRVQKDLDVENSDNLPLEAYSLTRVQKAAEEVELNSSKVKFPKDICITGGAPKDTSKWQRGSRFY